MVLSIQKYYPTDIKVGEIITMFPRSVFRKEHPIQGEEGFIEEIVIDPTPIEKLKSYQKKSALRFHSGTYSIYGLRQNNVLSHADWYIGDFCGLDFFRSGTMMTEFKLNQLYEEVGDTNHGFQHDILTVIRNLGRTKGMNDSD